MVRKETFTFLKNIKKNNNKEWFEDHKDQYRELHSDFKDFIYELADDIAVFDSRIKKGLKEKKTIKIFRIYRDARFSKNKNPYKQNFGGVIAPGGMDSGSPGYYLHIEPGNSFFGGGLHMPQSDVLKAVRGRIIYREKEFRKLLKANAFVDTYEALSDYDMIATVPRGFSKDHPAADLLRYKSLTVFKDLSDKDVVSKNLKKELIKYAKALKPLNDFLAKAIEK